MARFLALTFQGGSVKRGKRNCTIRRKVSVGPVALCFISIFILCLLSLFYLAQANQTATKGYEIRALEDQLETLREEQKKLELKAAELQSVRNVEEGSRQLNMVPVEKVVYLTPGGSAVAVSAELNLR